MTQYIPFLSKYKKGEYRMIKKLKYLVGNKRHSNKETNLNRNENGFMSFVEDYIAYADIKDLML